MWILAFRMWTKWGRGDTVDIGDLLSNSGGSMWLSSVVQTLARAFSFDAGDQPLQPNESIEQAQSGQVAGNCQ